jgi:hypothetical protein
MCRDPAAVTAIQAAVQVTAVATTGCPGHSENTVAWATLGGRFFGSAAATPEGEVKDRVAVMGIIGVSGATGPPDVFQARAVVFYGANRPCTAGMPLPRRDLRSVNRGETARLRVQWDRDNHRFICQRDDASAVFAPSAGSDTDPPASAATWVDARHVVPNWTATPRPMACIDAWFDEMMVNESAAPRAER